MKTFWLSVTPYHWSWLFTTLFDVVSSSASSALPGPFLARPSQLASRPMSVRVGCSPAQPQTLPLIPLIPLSFSPIQFSRLIQVPGYDFTSPTRPPVNALNRTLNPFIFPEISNGRSSKLFLPNVMLLRPSFAPNSISPSLSLSRLLLPKLSTEDVELEFEFL